MHEFNIFYSFWFLVLHTALSFLSPSLILYYALSDHLRIQMKSNGPWFACTYRILHVQCLLLKAWRRGWWWCWWASMCSPIDIKQSSDMEMGGQGKNGFSLRLCLDVGQGLSLPPSIYLSLSLSSSHNFHHFLYLLPSPTTGPLPSSIVLLFAVSPSLSSLFLRSLSICLMVFIRVMDQ